MYSRGKIFKGGELETNVQVISLLKLFTSKNYKVTLLAVTHPYKQISWTEELFCNLRVKSIT